ncbi:PREDICTED: uncharacterized protein LOC106745192 [Dinoponera quadriceps]|uniref:Uncharacterized protein LOC106745192 n=1 Tax=Dinoponera quadriceps TaxID=609295 RepID=A0A6P3XDV9_DINQU|nr:PREDICTED: uncharacterized protein LOC106745192 [Dinoponera quadriceps]
MSARSVKQLLERIRKISEANSGGECSISEDEQSKSRSDFPDNEESQHDDVFDDEDENVLNVRREQRRRRFLSDSESDNEQNIEDIVTARDETVWHRIKEGPTSERPPFTFKEVLCPTAHAKRRFMSGKVKSAFSVIIDHTIIDRIKKCTEAEALRVLGSKWDLPIPKLYTFIAVLYARGAYQAKNLSISYLWNSKWRPPLFSNAMSAETLSQKFRDFSDSTTECNESNV